MHFVNARTPGVRVVMGRGCLPRLPVVPTTQWQRMAFGKNFWGYNGARFVVGSVSHPNRKENFDNGKG
jgi:hypothetical protein